MFIYLLVMALQVVQTGKPLGDLAYAIGMIAAMEVMIADVWQHRITHPVTIRQAFALSTRDARGVHDEAAFMMSVFARAHRRLDKAWS